MLFKKLVDGNEIPMLGMGTWQLTDKEKCIEVIRYALMIGYTHIDTASIYENHKFIKEGIKDFPREKLFITSKLWRDFLDPKLVEGQCDKILMELGVDYLDLFLVHWPDRTKPLADISHQMQRLKEKGKIKSLGVSNYTIHHLQDLINQGIQVAMNQVEVHPFLYQKYLLDFCNKHSIAITAYCPIAKTKVLNDPTINDLAKKYNKTPCQISLRWLLQKDIVVIPKASTKKHIKENFEIFNFEISLEDIKKIDHISEIRPERLITPDFADFEY